MVALLLGLVIGVGMLFATLFSPYPFLEVVHSSNDQALIRGVITIVAVLGGLVIMRWSGPIQFNMTDGEWQRTSLVIITGLAVDLPLAVLNVSALQFIQGQAIVWQNPFAAMLDALQPGVLEEILYCFVLDTGAWVFGC